MMDQSDGFVFKLNEQVIRKIIKKYPIGKSCGADSIHTAMLRCLLDSSFLSHLSRLFRLCAAWGVTPQRWNQVITHLLIKTRFSQSVRNTRPVAMTAMFRRIFEIGILRAVNGDKYARWAQTHSAQGGFKRGYSCYTHLLIAHDDYALGDRAKGYVDLKGAYDLTMLSLLLKKLESRRAPIRFISLVFHLFHRCSMRLIVNHELSAPVFLKTGLLQGSILSPFLFNVFIDDLAEALQTHCQHHAKLHFLLYADDIRLSAYSKSELQPLMDIVADWCQKNGMEPGYSKCQVVGSPEDTYRVKLLGVELEVVEFYKYLGIEENVRGLDWDRYLERLLTKAGKSLNYLKSFGDFLSPMDRRILLQSRVFSVVEYGAPLLWHWVQEDTSARQVYLDRIQQEIVDKALKWLVGYKKERDGTVIKYVCESLCNVPSIDYRFHELATSFVSHLKKSSPSNPINAILEIHSIPQEVGFIDPWCLHRKTLAYRSKSTPLYEKYLSTTEHNRMDLKEFLKKERFSSWSTTSLRSRYIQNEARIALGVDVSLGITRDTDRWKALLWRKGWATLKSVCPGCPGSPPFSRGHIASRCQWIRNSFVVRKEDWGRYEEECEGLKDLDHNYCILDSLLNNKETEKFTEILKLLEDSQKE